MSNGLDATVTLDANTDSVDLTPGITETVFLNGGTLDVFQGSNASGSSTFSQTLQITSPAANPSSQSLSQGVVISTTTGSPPFDPASANVTLGTGSAVMYDLGAYLLTVTPDGGSRAGQTSTSIPISNSADFLLTEAPEPGMGFVLVAAPLMLRRRRR